MTEAVVPSNAPLPRRRLLSHGESAVATLGAALAFILLCAMAGSAGWALRTQRQHILQSNLQQARALGATLSQASEVMLSREELSSARRLLADAARQHKLTSVAIVLPDGGIIADAEPSRISAAGLPQAWPDGVVTPQVSETLRDQQIELRYPLQIVGRGGAELRMTAQVAQPPGAFWQAQAGFGVIGAAALFAFLLVYRYGRSRMAAMGAIREALLAVRQGEVGPTAMAVSDELGAEAAAWNGLLAEAERIRREVTIEKTRELLGPGRRNRTELDDACDAMPHGIILLDEQLRARYANGAAAVFLRTQNTKILGADVRSLVRDERLKAVLDGWSDPRNRRRTITETQETDGERLVLRWVMRPVRHEDGGAAMLVIEDVTQQRAADDARNAFVTQATHELRTPLTNIRLYLELAQEEEGSDPAMRAKCLNVISTEARRLERMVSDLLSTAEIEAGSLRVKRDDVRLDEVIRQLESDYAAQAEEKKLRLSVHLPPKLPVVQGDRGLIVMALHNLLANAIKYTPEGGSVDVTVSIVRDEVVIEVADTGIGISEEDQRRVFEKFCRANDRRIASIVGSGLGLSLAREVVRLHGGDITLQSELDKGSTFTMKVPVGAAA